MKISYKILLVIFVSTLISCKIDCDLLMQEDRKSECLIIVKEPLDHDQISLNAKGISLKDGKECICSENNRWWHLYSDQIEPGDTIIKRKGELTFNIHKKDTILTYNWECEGKVYE